MSDFKLQYDRVLENSQKRLAEIKRLKARINNLIRKYELKGEEFEKKKSLSEERNEV